MTVHQWNPQTAGP